MKRLTKAQQATVKRAALALVKPGSNLHGSHSTKWVAHGVNGAVSFEVTVSQVRTQLVKLEEDGKIRNRRSGGTASWKYITAEERRKIRNAKKERKAVEQIAKRLSVEEWISRVIEGERK